jgi:phage terminase large subunit-like protein
LTTSATKPKPKSREPKSTPNPAVDFINALHHTGDFHGQPFGLRPWQEHGIIRKIFDDKGKPKYKEVFIGIPRKCGKTEILGAIVDYLLFGTGKRSQQIYSASGDHKQAALIYNAATSMIRQSEALSNVAQIYKSTKRIECNPTDSFYEALSSEHALKYGLRPSVIIFDEMWVFPNRDLYKALTSAFGATINPLTITITTAGWDRSSLCWEQWKYATDVRDGLVDDPNFLPIIYAADPEDDWTSEETWRKAMPALGDFCQLDFIKSECRKAQQIPAYENSFKQLYLNVWTDQEQKWLSTEEWAACKGEFDRIVLPNGTPCVEHLYGQPCYAGLDMGITGDMACYWMVFPQPDGKVHIIGHGWVPFDGKWRDELRNKDRYIEWERMGYLTFTKGPGSGPYRVVDEDHIKRDIIAWHQKYPVRALYADRAYAMALIIDLFNRESINIKGIPQGAVTLNEACVTLEEMILGRLICHDGNPIMNWNIANASLIRTVTGLIFPNKSSSTERIDGLAALINALTAYKDDPENHGDSYYNNNPIMIL